MTRSIEDEIEAWKEAAAAHFAVGAGLKDDVAEEHAEAAWVNALEMCNGDAAEAVLLDPAEQVDEELSHWID